MSRNMDAGKESSSYGVTELQDVHEKLPAMTVNKGSSMPKRKKVTEEERKKILKHFQPIIANKKVPGQKQCLQYLKKEKSSLDWKKVKYVVYARIQRLKMQ